MRNTKCSDQLFFAIQIACAPVFAGKIIHQLLTVEAQLWAEFCAE